MAEEQVLGCVRCRKALTTPVRMLDELPVPYSIPKLWGTEPTVPERAVAVDPEPYYTDPDGSTVGSAGVLVANIEDGVDLVPHEDPERHSGCCGDNGFGGLNLRCPGCRSQIATIVNDCWSRQELRFEPDLVALMPQADTW